MMKKILNFIAFSVILFGCSNVNSPLPDFETKTIKGNSLSNKDLDGKIVVINIWATWCGPCIKEISELNALVEHYKNDNEIVFLAITDESERKVNQLLSTGTFSYEIIAEAKRLKHELHPGLVKSIPFHIIIGKDGETKFEYTGSRPQMKEFLIEEIEKVKKL